MGFWGELFSDILKDLTSGSKPVSRPEQKIKRTQTRGPASSAGYSPGDVLSGTVDYVGEKFAKVVSGDLTAVVFLNEIDATRVSNAADFLSVGQGVDFVLVQYDPRGWKASISAVPEARARETLESISEGDRVVGRVLELKSNGIVLDVGSFRAWVPLAELAWGWIEHPAEVVILDERIEVQIIRIALPDDWLVDKRQRKAQAVASLRECTPQPMSPSIPAAFSGIPFKVWAVAKTPRSVDAVARFVLEEMAEGKTRQMIAATTGLDRATLENIHDLLVDESLASSWQPSRRGKELIEAIRLAQDLNKDPVRGVFAGAAPQALRLVSLDEHRRQQTLPTGWPRPPYNQRVDDDFVSATDEEIPEALLTKLMPDEQRKKLTSLMQDSRIRVFLRRDGFSPWKGVLIDTPEYWLLAGLWRVFRPFTGKPYRPDKKAEWCENFLMVRCRSVLVGDEDGQVETLYFEPNTGTLWCLEDERKTKINDAPSRYGQFPVLPASVEKNAVDGAGHVVVQLQPESWCWVKVF